MDLDKHHKSDKQVVKALKYQMRTHIYHETINVLLNTLTGGFNHSNSIQGKYAHHLNGC